MTTSRGIDRRSFFASAAAGVVALGWPGHLAWSVAPHAASGHRVRILYYTDIHARTEWDTPVAMRLAADAMNQHHADLILCGGDLITDGYNGTAESLTPRWDAYFDALHNRLVPAPHAMIGNHDLVGVEPPAGAPPEPDPRAEFRRRLGLDRTYRSFDAHGYHIILLDGIEVTRDELKYRGYIDENQLAWLREDLAAVAPETPIILMSHMPLLTSFFQRTDAVTAAVPANRGVVNNREVLDLFAGHRLLLVLQGHLHVNEMLRWGETTFITGGAVCGKWWRGDWHGTDAGYGLLELDGTGVQWTYHTYGWQPRRPAGM